MERAVGAQRSIVTGLDATRIRAGHASWVRDPRLRHVAHAMKRPSSTPEEDHGESVQATLLNKLSRLLLMPVDTLRASLGRPLAELGMDSMVGAEVRGWVWRRWKVDVPLVQMLEGRRSLAWLVECAERGV